MKRRRGWGITGRYGDVLTRADDDLTADEKRIILMYKLPDKRERKFLDQVAIDNEVSDGIWGRKE